MAFAFLGQAYVTSGSSFFLEAKSCSVGPCEQTTVHVYLQNTSCFLCKSLCQGHRGRVRVRLWPACCTERGGEGLPLMPWDARSGGGHTRFCPRSLEELLRSSGVAAPVRNFRGESVLFRVPRPALTAIPGQSPGLRVPRASAGPSVVPPLRSRYRARVVFFNVLL